MKAMKYLLMGLVLTVGAACGDDEENAVPANCPDVSGLWRITQHCTASLVGQTVSVAQVGCTVSTTGAFQGFTGSAAAGGLFTIGGTFGGDVITCTGNASSLQINLVCQPDDCGVEMQR